MAIPPFLPHLKELLNQRQATKMGQIRAAWPHIQEALQAGNTLKAVWERLRADGVDIGYNRLSEYIGRLERRTGYSTTGLGPATKQAEKEKPGSVPRPVGPTKNDPAANLRERLDRSSGFAYRG